MPASVHISCFRWLAKFCYFGVRGNGPAKARWLATHDAVKRNAYHDVPLADLQAAWSGTGSWIDLETARGEIRSSRLGLPFKGNDLLARGYATVLAMHAIGFTVERQGDALFFTNKSWRLRVTNDEELSMIREIFLERCYDLRLSGSWLVLDVGANVGMASLFFAAQPWVKEIIAFEPFGPTAMEHAINVAANPTLAKKIRLEHYGLGERQEMLEVSYQRELHGSMSVTGLGSWRGLASDRAEKIKIEIRPAADAMRELGAVADGQRVLAKIDCEGSEYGILRNLEQADLLTKIDVIVMEWHEHRPDELLGRLKQAGFSLHVRPLADNWTLGLILAWQGPGQIIS
jgi:FkbM family methyltransferase